MTALQEKAVTRRLKEYKQIALLMKEAFQKKERIPIWILSILARQKNVSFIAYYDEGVLCGITYTIEYESTVYLLYLAVNGKIRSKGYGAKILAQLKESTAGKNIVINVETPNELSDNNAQRIRRIGFYKRNGFSVCDFVLTIAKLDYTVMTTNMAFNKQEFEWILKKYRIGDLKE